MPIEESHDREGHTPRSPCPRRGGAARTRPRLGHGQAGQVQHLLHQLHPEDGARQLPRLQERPDHRLPHLLQRCAGVPAIGFPKTPILNGAFTRTATIKNVLGKKITYTLNGRFVGPKLATGSINATGAGKTCKAVSFKARFSGTGAAQIG
jgi:hypothetical protein